MIRHAGLIARIDRGLWRGVLIEGPSGSGKSDLALRSIGTGFRLVADDRTLVFVSNGGLYGKAPAALSGLLEVRGVGIIREPALPMAPIVLLARCLDRPDASRRLPDPTFETVAGVRLPVVDLWPFDTSAPDQLIRAMEHLGAHRQQEYDAPFAPNFGRGGV